MIDAEKLKATDEQIIEWAERHGILNGITDLMGLRCAFDDARTLLNSEPAGVNADGLLPCPFCGANPFAWTDEHDHMYACCKNQKCQVHNTEFTIDEWNTRPSGQSRQIPPTALPNELPWKIEFALDYLLGYMSGEPEEALNKLKQINEYLRPQPPGGDV